MAKKPTQAQKDLVASMFLAFHNVVAQPGVKCKKPEKCFMEMIKVVSQ